MRAAMNIFTSALLYSLAPDSGACTAAAVNTQRAVLTGLLFLCSTDAGQVNPLPCYTPLVHCTPGDAREHILLLTTYYDTTHYLL